MQELDNTNEKNFVKSPLPILKFISVTDSRLLVKKCRFPLREYFYRPISFMYWVGQEVRLRFFFRCY